jgi:hypothetical protein
VAENCKKIVLTVKKSLSYLKNIRTEDKQHNYPTIMRQELSDCVHETELPGWYQNSYR